MSPRFQLASLIDRNHAHHRFNPELSIHLSTALFHQKHETFHRHLPSSAPMRQSQKISFGQLAKLDGANLDIFNGIASELLHSQYDDLLISVLRFVHASIDDYPPEFFLQSYNRLMFLISSSKLRSKFLQNFQHKF